MSKKLCFFTTTFSSHEQVRMAYAEKYFPNDVELFLITPKSQNKYDLKRTKILESPTDKLNFILYLRRFCRNNHIDLLLNLGTCREVYASVLATVGLKTKFMHNEHGNIIDFPNINEKILPKLRDKVDQFFTFLCLHFAKSIICGASDQAEELREKIFLVKKKIIFLPLIIDERLFGVKNKQTMRKKLRLPLNKDILIFVGRISLLKGSDILYTLAQNNPDKLFLLVGAELDKRFSEERLNNVILLGPKGPKELSEYYSASDLSILPSKIEGFGLVSREAMLCGTPALVSNILALKTIPKAIVAENNIKDMQTAINSFFSIPLEKREKDRLNLRKAIIEETSYNNLKDKYIEVFYNKI